MSKPSRIKLPLLAKCDNPLCNDGLVQRTFHTDVCFKCEGAGVIANDSGEAIHRDVLIAAMKQCIKQQRNQIRELKRQLVAQDEEVDRYRGMSSRLGGKHRMD